MKLERMEGINMHKFEDKEKARPTRREFLKTSTVAFVGGAVATRLGDVPAVYAAGSDEIRVGVIGCGGRGTGAAEDAVNAAPGVRLVAMADVFKDKIESSLEALNKSVADKIDVPEDRRFVGLDAFEKVIGSDVNYIILATPPGFRPQHLKAAVAAGKHIFCEKPMAVDGPGIRACFEVYEEAKKKGLGVGVGTQRHHQAGYIATLKQIHAGAIGEIVAARAYWNQGPIWVHARQEGWTDLEWQLRNWYYFTWLSGDHIVEQHIHNLDVVNWAMKAHPVRCVGLGGRQVRTAPEYGHIYDHFAIDYEYENGVHMMSMCRQIPNCQNNVSEALHGTRGFCQVNRYTITGAKPWKHSARPREGVPYASEQEKEDQPYVQEHTDLIASIRAGKPINELKECVESTLTAIMGRMAAYTGKMVTWEQALNSEENLVPGNLEWNMSLPVPPVAMPGQTELR
jgi:myo-inositol 2-dehydrogenase/D-chiro-inositol 1-dehydrogenase